MQNHKRHFPIYSLSMHWIIFNAYGYLLSEIASRKELMPNIVQKHSYYRQHTVHDLFNIVFLIYNYIPLGKEERPNVFNDKLYISDWSLICNRCIHNVLDVPER